MKTRQVVNLPPHLTLFLFRAFAAESSSVCKTMGREGSETVIYVFKTREEALKRVHEWKKANDEARKTLSTSYDYQSHDGYQTFQTFEYRYFVDQDEAAASAIASMVAEEYQERVGDSVETIVLVPFVGKEEDGANVGSLKKRVERLRQRVLKAAKKIAASFGKQHASKAKHMTCCVCGSEVAKEYVAMPLCPVCNGKATTSNSASTEPWSGSKYFPWIHFGFTFPHTAVEKTLLDSSRSRISFGYYGGGGSDSRVENIKALEKTFDDFVNKKLRNSGDQWFTRMMRFTEKEKEDSSSDECKFAHALVESASRMVVSLGVKKGQFPIKDDELNSLREEYEDLIKDIRAAVEKQAPAPGTTNRNMFVLHEEKLFASKKTFPEAPYTIPPAFRPATTKKQSAVVILDDYDDDDDDDDFVPPGTKRGATKKKSSPASKRAKKSETPTVQFLIAHTTLSAHF